MGLLDTLMGMFEPDTEETVLYELTCDDCGESFMTHITPADAACEECGSVALTEESRLYAGGDAPGV